MIKFYSNKVMLVVVLLLMSQFVWSAESVMSLPGLSISVDQAAGSDKPLATSIKVLLLLTVLSIAPAFMVAMTSFTRIVIVLSMLRHAIGMQQTPPNTVIISLSLFLTIFSMMPMFSEIHNTAYVPYVNKSMSESEALVVGGQSLKNFMVKHTREQDLALMANIANQPVPKNIGEIKFDSLIPAFMLSELKAAFQIGFVIFLPFLLIDLIVAAILMSMGMLMVPPMMISLPIKILMFVLIDGWNLVVNSLMSSLL